jgi:hypothetical protein
MLMKRTILLAALIFSACQSQIIEPQSTKPTTDKSSVSNNVIITRDFLITTDGIGKAKLGMTLGELKQLSKPNAKFETIPSITIDSNAIAVSQDGLVQYYILYPHDSTFTDNDPITKLMTDNYNYQTTRGVKVGTTIEEAENIYGDAILAYNPEGEPGEYVTFGEENPRNVRFKASYFKLTSNGLGYSGLYSQYPGISSTTNKYRSDAEIAAIEVSCTSTECS